MTSGRGLTLIAVSFCLQLLSIACGGDPPVRSYHTRGVVTEISGAGADLSVAIHHERIAGFTARDGQLSDMPSMTMLFGVAGGVPAALWNPGQKLAFDFTVRWDQRPALQVVRAQALPPTTELALTDEHH